MKKLSVILIIALVFISSPALGVEPEGTYKYTQKGFDGEMKVTKTIGQTLGSRPYMISLETVNRQSAHNCEIEKIMEVDAARISSSSTVEMYFAEKDGAKFSVKFTSSGAVIKVEDAGGMCGMSGGFDGKWVRKASRKK